MTTTSENRHEKGVALMPNAIFLGIEEYLPQYKEKNNNQCCAIYLNQIDEAIQSIGNERPQLVVIDSILDGSQSGGFLNTILAHFADFRSPVLVVDSEEPNRVSTLYYWISDEQRYIKRPVTLSQAIQIIEMLWEEEQTEQKVTIQDVKNLGYNNYVSRNGRNFQIQTEIYGKSNIVIRTTIMHAGAAIDVLTKLFQIDEIKDIVHARTILESQHKLVLAEVQQGKYD